MLHSELSFKETKILRYLHSNTSKSTRTTYSFQGQERDDEVKGAGNSYNFEYRMHDPRVGRFFAVDPLAAKYAYNGTYNFSENRVVDGVELEGLQVVPANEIWDLRNKYTTVTKKNNVDFFGPYKVATIHGRQVSLYEIKSGPNKGNYLAIGHFGGDYTNFDPAGFRNPNKIDKNYRWEELYVVGSERVPDGPFSGELSGGIAVDNLIDACDSKKDYSSELAFVHAANLYGIGYFSDETGKWVNTDTPEQKFERASDYLIDQWTDPYNFLPGPEIKLNIKHPSSIKNYNNFQKITKGTYNKKNFGLEFQKARKKGYNEWLKQELQMPIEKPNEEKSKKDKN